MPTTQLRENDAAASPSSRTLCSSAATIIGLNTLSSKWPLEPAMEMPALLPITWHATIVSASHCVGLTLPGMMELPGSFSGSCSSPRPQRGPLPRKRTSLATFMSETATTLSAPLISTSESCAASASNLLGAVTKGRPVSAATWRATATS